MKRWIVAVAVAVSACSGNPVPVSPGATTDGGQVVLATFTADVDPAAGTFVIRTAPTEAGRALRVLDGDVTVANKMVGDPPAPVTFFDSAQGPGRACTDGHEGKVWGATVTLTNRLSETILGAVYAEITSATPVTALQSCSSATAPPDLSATPGLWWYGQIDAGGTGEVDWVFRYTTALRFSFSGRIVGVRISRADWAGSPAVQRPVNNSWSAGTGIADAGTHVAVAGKQASAPHEVDFVDKTTGAYVRSVTVPVRVNAMGVAGDRIWVGTESDGSTSYVGHVNKDGTGVATLDPTDVDAHVLAIVADPTTPDVKAWVLWNDSSSTYFIAAYEPGAGLGTATAVTPASLAYSMMVGGDGRLYVANAGGGWIDVFTLGTTATLVDAWAGISCASPWMVVPGPDGKVYFNSFEGWVCSYSTDGTLYEEWGWLGGEIPRGLAVGSTGRIWVSTGSDGHLWELDTSGATNDNVLLATGVELWPLAIDGAGSLWYGDATGLWKVAP